MEPFEFLLLFAALLLGVAVTDLVSSLHRLFTAGRRVVWDWLAPLGALVAFLKIVSQWWVWYSRAHFIQALTWEAFLAVLTRVILLFLMTAAALPDLKPADETIDLRTHWRSVQTRYWAFFLAHWAIGAGVSLYTRANGALVSSRPSGWLVVPVTVAMIFLKGRISQTAGLLFFWVIYSIQFVGESLGG
jgi:hypothetical protein